MTYKKKMTYKRKWASPILNAENEKISHTLKIYTYLQIRQLKNHLYPEYKEFSKLSKKTTKMKNGPII